MTSPFDLLRRLNRRQGGAVPRYSTGDDSIPVLLSPGAVWACPGGHLNRDEATCRCGQAMEWREA